MTNLQVDYFLHVAYTKSISRSAEELYVSPPAISKQITLLEQELNLKLFSRGARGMELTEEGQIMFDHWATRQAAFELAIQRARSVNSQHSQTLHLGFMSSWAIQKPLLQLKGLLREQKDSVNLVAHSYFDPANPQRLESGALDAALCIGEDLYDSARTTDLHISLLTKIRKAILFSSDHPLAGKEDLTPEDFNSLPLLAFSASIRPGAQYENLKDCGILGIHPRLIIKDSVEDVFFSTSLGEGFMIGDQWLEHIQLPGFSHLLLPDHHSIYLVWSAHNQNPALHSLQECLSHVNWSI